MRLTPDQNHVRAAKAVLAISTVWVVVSLFMVALRCQLSTPWMDYDGQCTNLVRNFQTLVMAPKTYMCTVSSVANNQRY